MLTHNRTPMPSRLLLNDRTSLNHDWLSHNLRTENLPRWNSKSSREKYFLHTEGLRSLHLRFILERTEKSHGNLQRWQLKLPGSSKTYYSIRTWWWGGIFDFFTHLIFEYVIHSCFKNEKEERREGGRKDQCKTSTCQIHHPTKCQGLP